MPFPKVHNVSCKHKFLSKKTSKRSCNFMQCPKIMSDCNPNMHTLHIVYQQIFNSETRANGAFQSLENVTVQPI